MGGSQLYSACSCPPPMCSLSEEERVRAVLRDLRKRTESEEVREDVERLEKVLSDPLFRQYNKKSSENAPRIHQRERLSLVEFLREAVEKELREGLKENQKLVFVEIHASSLRPEVLDPREPGNKLLVAGPKDIKSRSTGTIRIGDRIHAVATRYALCEPSKEGGANAQGGVSLSSVSGGPIVRGPTAVLFEEICDRAQAEGSLIAIAAIRESTNMVLSGDWVQVEVIRLSTEGGGLGFGIVGGTSTGVVVKTILPGSPADKDRRLRPGDHILQVGNVNTHGMSSQQVATILRQQDPIVEMIVGRPINYAERPPDTSNCWTMSTRAALCAASLEDHIQRQMGTTSESTISQMTPSTVSPSTSNVLVEEENTAKPTESTIVTTNGNHSYQISTSELATQEKKTVDEKSQPTLQKTPSVSVDYTSLQPSTSPKPIPFSSPPYPVSEIHRKPEGASETKALPNGNASRSTASSPQTPTTTKISLRTLQEMALTVFLRENWQNTNYETVEVTLVRDPALGLGITVAGYVHRKEEIGGVFVKSLVPRSAATQSGRIWVHDLILEVNGTSLEHLSHADSVRTLVKSGDRVTLKLIRFPPNSLQAQCLKMLQEQETDTQVIDVQSSNPDLVTEWKRRLSNDIDIISAIVKPDRKEAGDGGLGISLEGTVDVLNGHQLCPHHYIESIRHGGPAAETGLLQAGDELLQVNHSPLYGESHVTVRQALTRAVHSGAPVTLIVARKTQHVNLFQPKTERSLPLAYPLLAAGQDRMVKAKSEVNISFPSSDTSMLLRQVSRRLRSRSLEPFTGLAIWNCVPLVFFLEKDSRGLGFSIVDYQDPLHPGESVIVIQSLVPGGLAQADGRIVPGDRLLFVNQHDLSNCSIERAVAVLKAAPMGRVRLGIAKPVPIDQCRSSSHSPIFTRSERLLARGSSPRGKRRQTSVITSSQETVWIGAEQYRKLHPQSYYPSRSPSCSRSQRSLDGSDFSMASWSPCSTRSISPVGSPLSLRGSWAYDVIYLPSHLERSVKITKGALPLGVVLDANRDKGVNGCVVKSICGKKAIALDGRIQVGDYVVKINSESLRNATSSQARAILKRTNLIGTQCNVTYITAADAKIWKDRFHRDTEPQSPVINRLSPKVFPKFYRSPYLSRKTSFRDQDDSEPLSETSEAPMSLSETCPLDDAPINEADKASEKIVDELEIDSFVCNILNEALRDAILELAVSSAIPDWKGRPPIPRSPSSEDPVANRSWKTVVSTSPVSALPFVASPSFSSPTQSSQSSSDSLQGSTDRQGSPPYTVLRKSSHSSKASRNSKREAETLRKYPAERSIGSKESLIRKDCELSSQARECPEVSGSGETQLARDTGKECSEQPSTSSLCTETVEYEKMPEKTEEIMNRMTSRTPSTGSESINQQAKHLARSKFWGEARTVVLHREPNKSFGISIVGGRVEVSQKGGLPGTGNTVSGIFIKSVLPNSPAGKSGMMNMGDRVISVNDVDLREATHEQAVAAIKHASNPVRFVLQSLHSFTPQQQMISSASNSTVGSIRIESAKPEEIPVFKTDSPILVTVPKTIPQIVRKEESITTESSKTEDNQVNSESKEDESNRNFSPPLISPSIIERRESVQSKNSMHIDEILTKEISEKDEHRDNLSRQQSAENELGKDVVKMKDGLQKRDSMKKQDSMRSMELRKESCTSGPLIVSDVSSSETHEEEPVQILDTSVEMVRLGIESESAAMLEKRPDDDERESKYFYTKKKIQQKYGHLSGDILIVECDRVPEAGLGISLAGNKERNKLSVFVIAVKVACPLAIRAGDELLEVNGRVLYGKSHVTASAIVKKCCEGGGLEMLICRRDGSLDECAVRPGEPSTAIVSLTSEQQSCMPPTVDISVDSTLHNIETSRKKSFSVERTTAIETGRETLIEIDKDGKGLGLSIVGGSDTVLGTVVIHEVYPDGAAAHDGRLKPGDQVLEVNNVSLRGVSHDQAICSLRRTPPKVRLLIYRDVNLQLSLLDPTQIYNMFEVELHKKPGRGLGLSIVGRKNEPGVYVSEVVKGGAAEADNRLMTGDQILAVNGQDVANSMQEDVAAMLKTCVGKVTLKVGRWKITETANRVHAAAEAALGKSQKSPRLDDVRPSTSEERPDVPPPAPPMRPIITHTPPEGESLAEADVHLSPVTEEPSSGVDQRSLIEDDRGQGSLAMDILHNLKEEGSDTFMLELKKVPDQQLGMGIGKRTRGILVTSLQPGSAAAEKLKVGDRILAVNALPVTDQLSAVTFVKASGSRLYLQIARPRSSPQ